MSGAKLDAGDAMRTTMTLPDELAREVRELTGGGSLSQFTRDALRERVQRLQRDRLVRELEDGYRAEAEDPSLDIEWSAVESEGL
jgi:hypothetical protein